MWDRLPRFCFLILRKLFEFLFKDRVPKIVSAGRFAELLRVWSAIHVSRLVELKFDENFSFVQLFQKKLINPTQCAKVASWRRNASRER